MSILMSLLLFLQFIGGLGLLIFGAELLVRGASRLAAALGMSSLVIGLTVVAYGTSAPELAVCLKAALSNQSDIALGNVIGSNISNILLTLGLTAVIRPLLVSRQLIRFDVPVMIGFSVLVLVLGQDHAISRSDGSILFASFILYTFWLIRQGHKQSEEDESLLSEKITRDNSATMPRGIRNAIFILGGLVLLVLGARWLVDAAVAMARSFGLSELIIGLTIIAVGTSLPEIATSIVAAARGSRDLVTGNLIGSNISNLLIILGLTAMLSPRGVKVAPAALHFDIPVMIAAAVACLPIFFTKRRVGRVEGAVFVLYYLAYIVYLVLAASAHDALEPFSNIMMWFVIPLTVITLLMALFRSLKEERSNGQTLPPS